MNAKIIPLNAQYPICEDGVPGHWLLPGNWTRGQALAHVAQEERQDFILFRARRAYYHWLHLAYGLAGWQFEDGVLSACAQKDADAETYWEVRYQNTWHLNDAEYNYQQKIPY